jgi:hypothetical protein
MGWVAESMQCSVAWRYEVGPSSSNSLAAVTAANVAAVTADCWAWR